MKISTFILVTSIFGSTASFAYECKTTIEPTTKTENFINNLDGSVTDMRYGLQWQICSYGQTYDAADGNCKGEQKQYPTWSEALLSQDAINSAKLNGHSDWRLPSIKELQSIVERSCRQPAINNEIFKGTANGAYWSHTPDGTVNPELKGRIVDMSDGSEFYRPTEPTKYVRHVRVIND